LVPVVSPASDVIVDTTATLQPVIVAVIAQRTEPHQLEEFHAH
jgi:hypothetical protein